VLDLGARSLDTRSTSLLHPGETLLEYPFNDTMGEAPAPVALSGCFEGLVSKDLFGKTGVAFRKTWNS
jgi:hypothetical protein